EAGEEAEPHLRPRAEIHLPAKKRRKPHVALCSLDEARSGDGDEADDCRAEEHVDKHASPRPAAASARSEPESLHERDRRHERVDHVEARLVADSDDDKRAEQRVQEGSGRKRAKIKIGTRQSKTDPDKHGSMHRGKKDPPYDADRR